MTKAFHYIFLILCLLNGMFAGNITLSGRAEAGNRSTGEDYLEEDNDNDYKYQSFYFRCDQSLNQRFMYNLTATRYMKSYDALKSENNRTTTLNANSTYAISPFMTFKFHIKYRDKNFTDAVRYNYTNFVLDPSLNIQFHRDFSAEILTGINRYDYTESSDRQMNYVSKINGRGYFFDRRLVTIASYRIQVLKKPHLNRKKNKQMRMAGAAYRFNLPFLYKITGRINYGDQDTKDNDTHDYDYDYTELDYYVRGDFNMLPELKANLIWQQFGKDYLTYKRDHHGYRLVNGWDYYPVNDRLRSIWFNVDLGVKSVTYTENPQNGYDKQELALKANYRKKKHWKLSCTGIAYFYQYRASEKNKHKYNGYFSIEKSVLESRGLLTIDLKYRYTQYLHRVDKTSVGIRLGMIYNL